MVPIVSDERLTEHSVADVSKRARVRLWALSGAAAVDVVLVVPTETCSRMRKHAARDKVVDGVVQQHASFTLPTVISGT
jgi:hypothetical protein